jgi:pimeloyl-ACP methyl ester carboxylesterase
MENLERVNINNSVQWILVRGNSAGPLVLQVQAGPGLPMIPEASTMQKLHHLEEQYLVAYWDQRACGKSFDKNADPTTINFSQLTDDVIACTEHLLSKYKKKKAIVIGYSIGATVSLLAAAKFSHLFSQLFLVGIDIDIPYANHYALEFAMKKARVANNQKLINQVLELGRTPILETKKFQQRARLLTDFGGIKTGSTYNQIMLSSMKNMLFSNAYRLKDIQKTIQGMEFSQNALLPEMNSLNLFNQLKRVGVPVHFLQGKLDVIAPYDMATKFYNYLQAETKTFTDFEHSAHLPQYEEPGKFARFVKENIKP